MCGLDLLPFVPDFLHMGSPVLVRGFMCHGFSLLLYGMACPEPLLLTLDLVQAGSSMALRSFLRPESLLPAYGMTWLGPALFAPDYIHPGFLLPLQGHA